MRSKILILVVALALAGVAAVLAVSYLNSARSSIASESEPIEVLVAQDNVPRGLSIEELMQRGLVKIEQVPRRFVAADAVSSARIVEGQVLAVPLSAGEQLTKTRFQFPSQAGLAYTVPNGFIALTVPVDDVTGVAGLVKPGDSVVLFATLKPKSDQSAYTTQLIPKARVLAVGAVVTAEAPANTDQTQQSGVFSSGGQSATAATYRTVTLALSLVDAERVSFVGQVGVLQLGLLSQTAAATSTVSPAVAPTTFGNVQK